MPLFEYQCQNCGHLIEVLASPREPAPKKCPKCGKPKLERKFSTFSSASSKSDRCSPRSA